MFSISSTYSGTTKAQQRFRFKLDTFACETKNVTFSYFQRFQDSSRLLARYDLLIFACVDTEQHEKYFRTVVNRLNDAVNQFTRVFARCIFSIIDCKEFGKHGANMKFFVPNIIKRQSSFP